VLAQTGPPGPALRVLATLEVGRIDAREASPEKIFLDHGNTDPAAARAGLGHPPQPASPTPPSAPPAYHLRRHQPRHAGLAPPAPPVAGHRRTLNSCLSRSALPQRGPVHPPLVAGTQAVAPLGALPVPGGFLLRPGRQLRLAGLDPGAVTVRHVAGVPGDSPNNRQDPSSPASWDGGVQRSCAIGRLVHSGLTSARHGARNSTIVTLRPRTLELTWIWSRACSGTRCSQ
jgi:hypothetical protein